MTETITYEIARLDYGPKRWAVTRNGVVINTYRERKSAERDVDLFRGFLDLMGHESALSRHYFETAVA